jgi:hypothetical protein
MTEEKITRTEGTIAIARAAYEAYVSKDRAAIEKLIAPDFHFTSPLDNRINRGTYFARCWPNSETITDFDLSISFPTGTGYSSPMKGVTQTGSVSATPRS